MNKVCKEFINSTRKFIFPLIRTKHYKFLIPIHKDFSKKTSTRKKDDYDMFYGIPLSKSKPKNEEELLNLFNHVRNIEDIFDIYNKNKELFTEMIIPVFIDFLYKVFSKQYFKVIKGNTENIPTVQLEDIQKEHVHSENTIINIFNELENEIFTKKFSFRCQIHFYFCSIFEFKFTFNKENNYIINLFDRLENDPFVLATIEHPDVIKFTKIICNYEKFGVPAEVAKKNIYILSKEIITMDFSLLTHHELAQFISSLTHKNLCEDVDLFTRFEPHILKFLDKYNVSDQIRLFCNYIEISAGTDFFLDTLVFSIKNMLKNASLKDILLLLNVSKRSVWEKRYYNDSHFNDVFENIHLLIMNKLNSANKIDLIRLSMRLVELGYNEKTIVQLLSVKLLAQSESMNFEDFIKIVFYNFTLIDFNSEIFLRKCIDIVRMNLLCLKNGLKGYNDIDNLQGIMEKELIYTLKNKFISNNDKLIDMIKSSHNFKIFKETFNILSSLLWAMTYYSMHVDLKSVYYTEIMNDIIEVFNKFIEKISNFDKIHLEIINLHRITQFNLFSQMNAKKYNITNKLNLDFLKRITFYHPQSEEGQSETYLYFDNKIRKDIKELKDLNPYKLKNRTINIENLKFTLLPSYTHEKKQKNGEIKYTFIYIDDINLYLHHSKIYNALIKLRKQFCKEMNIDYIDLDYYEWKEINEVKELNLEKIDKQIENYFKMKFIKFNV